MRYAMIVLLAAAACATTPEEKAAQVIERHGGYCETFGFKKGTDGWRQCIISRERESQSGTICTFVYGSVICN